jgi:hypothetical protein
MESRRSKAKPFNRFLRALIESGFIIFLFYSNLLMGEFTNTGNARGKSILWGIHDIFTVTNFEIAIAASILGYLVFEFLRKKL